ncbi:MAG: FxsA family protein, partial [Pelagibacteraceae bacterium]|nr:FxsA family protein [Pelagibacteraceae bacterium]
ITGLNTLRSAIYKLRKNKDQIPLFEIISGASIAFAALLLIIPGFITDVFGFLLLMPFTRNMLTNLYLKKKPNVDTGPKDYIDGEVIKEEDKDGL